MYKKNIGVSIPGTQRSKASSGPTWEPKSSSKKLVACAIFSAILPKFQRNPSGYKTRWNNISKSFITPSNFLRKDSPTKGAKKKILEYGLIFLGDFQGYRSPNLQSNGNFTMDALQELDFSFDNSYSTIENARPSVWPYTLDYGFQQVNGYLNCEELSWYQIEKLVKSSKRILILQSKIWFKLMQPLTIQ